MFKNNDQNNRRPNLELKMIEVFFTPFFTLAFFKEVFFTLTFIYLAIPFFY